LQVFTMATHAMAVVNRHAGRDLLRVDSLCSRSRLQDRKGNQGRQSSPPER
jgi:hypothetical protein